MNRASRRRVTRALAVILLVAGDLFPENRFRRLGESLHKCASL
jgi:hypothetical protein